MKTTAVRLAQLEQLLAVNFRVLLSSTFAALLLAYMQRGVVSLKTIIVWLASILAANFIRIAIGFYQRKNPVTAPELIEKRLNQFRLGVIVTGVLWGSSSFLMFPAGFIHHQMFLIYLISGLAAGAVVSYSIDRFCALSFLSLTLLPLLIELMLKGGTVYTTMSLAGFGYLAFMIVSIRNFYHDLTEGVLLRHQAVEREQEIKQLAFYDSLTNLPNRRLLLDRLDHALVTSNRTNKRGALLFLDLDHFKVLNDTLGHDMGDLLLKQVSERLTKCVRASDTVARLGGDEFVVMLEELSDNQAEAGKQVDAISQQILDQLNMPYMLKGFEYRCTPSVGVAMFGVHGQSHEDLLKHADIAMYQAKRAGRNVVRLFDYKMRDSVGPTNS